MESKKSNLFRKPYPLANFYSFLEDTCKSTPEYYLIDQNVFHNLTFHEKHLPFLQELEDYYYECQHTNYIKRDWSYRSFITIVRQICSYYNISITFTKQYNHGLLDLRYFIEKGKM